MYFTLAFLINVHTNQQLGCTASIIIHNLHFYDVLKNAQYFPDNLVSTLLIVHVELSLEFHKIPVSEVWKFVSERMNP